MKRGLLVALVAVGVGGVGTTQARGEGLPKWVRYAGAGALCATTGWDAYTTVVGGQLGAKELNPLLRGANGGPVTWKVSVFKGVQCGFAVWQARKEQAGTLRFVINVGLAGLTGWVANRNQGIIDGELARRKGQGGMAAQGGTR